MGKIIDLTKDCPKCGERMYYKTDIRAKYYLRRLVDPSENGCEPDYWLCPSCKWNTATENYGDLLEPSEYLK
jgi:predicted nucleic-acid-binding Zn-ribbon protein